jgi:hypothetical protein
VRLLNSNFGTSWGTSLLCYWHVCIPQQSISTTECKARTSHLAYQKLDVTTCNN